MPKASIPPAILQQRYRTEFAMASGDAMLERINAGYARQRAAEDSPVTILQIAT